eukprot:m.331426 g.331426  ORF g.331426 m.331426 type:complete len:51 (-) comp16513_c0_seq40:2392-2544(-)
MENLFGTWKNPDVLLSTEPKIRCVIYDLTEDLAGLARFESWPVPKRARHT